MIEDCPSSTAWASFIGHVWPIDISVVPAND